jgi:hypothetical protein
VLAHAVVLILVDASKRPCSRLLGPPPSLVRPGQAEALLGSQFLPGGTGDVGGHDTGGVPVETAAGTVVANRGPRVSVGSGFLDIAQGDARIETGRERFSNHAEWVTSKTALWGCLVLVDAVLALPWPHHSVQRCNQTGCDIVTAAATP